MWIRASVTRKRAGGGAFSDERALTCSFRPLGPVETSRHPAAINQPTPRTSQFPALFAGISGPSIENIPPGIKGGGHPPSVGPRPCGCIDESPLIEYQVVFHLF